MPKNILKFCLLGVALLFVALVAYLSREHLVTEAPPTGQGDALVTQESLVASSDSNQLLVSDAETHSPEELGPEVPTRQVSEEMIRYAGSIPVVELPAHLNAKSAIQLSDSGALADFLDSDSDRFSMPLTQQKRVEISVLKRVTKRDGRVILFGQLSGAKSHYTLVLDQGKLTSGTFTLFDSNDQYLLSTLNDGRLVLSLTDPDIEVPMCGCDGCSSHSEITSK